MTVVVTKQDAILVVQEDVKPAIELSIPLSTSVVVAQGGPQGPIGTGIPEGGNVGDLIVKTASGTAWIENSFPNDAPRSITIVSPIAGDSLTLFRTSKEVVFSNIIGLVSGNNPNVLYEIKYASDRTASGIIAASSNVTSITVGNAATIQNMPVPSGCYVWLNILSSDGATEFNLSLLF